MTYNIHHGEGMDQRVDLERIASVIRKFEPDVVGLEEVDQATSRSGGIRQAETLSRLTGLGVVFGSSFAFEGGEYGNALLSRWPIQDFSVAGLPSPAEEEQRSLLTADLEIGEQPVRVLVTHLNQKNGAVRSAQAGFVADRLEAFPTPTILVGDLNATPKSATLKRLTRTMALADTSETPTFPSGNPSVKIDYILHDRLSGWEVVEAMVPEESIASDHRPLCATLKLKN
ncbi:MAG: endonuclease/exonuclease/phosphatase family protein [Verrucomicrobiota bacterium]